MLTCKSVDPADYAALKKGVSAVSWTAAWLRGKGVRVDDPHPHRMWEYASAYETALHSKASTAIDVGCGYSVLGPALSMRAGFKVIELDTDPKVITAREQLAELLDDGDLEARVFTMPAELPEAGFVSCISVMEHLPPEAQEAGWRALARAARHALVATVDFGPRPGETWANNELRHTQFGWDAILQVALWLEEEGLTVGELDLEYHGNQVFDYSFYRLIACREPA